jgi:hypothetical protein
MYSRPPPPPPPPPPAPFMNVTLGPPLSLGILNSYKSKIDFFLGLILQNELLEC